MWKRRPKLKLIHGGSEAKFGEVELLKCWKCKVAREHTNISNEPGQPCWKCSKCGKFRGNKL